MDHFDSNPWRPLSGVRGQMNAQSVKGPERARRLSGSATRTKLPAWVYCLETAWLPLIGASTSRGTEVLSSRWIVPWVATPTDDAAVVIVTATCGDQRL